MGFFDSFAKAKANYDKKVEAVLHSATNEQLRAIINNPEKSAEVRRKAEEELNSRR